MRACDKRAQLNYRERLKKLGYRLLQVLVHNDDREIVKEFARKKKTDRESTND